MSHVVCSTNVRLCCLYWVPGSLRVHVNLWGSSSVADPGCFSRIPDDYFYIPDPRSGFFYPRSRIRIPNTELTKNVSIFNPKRCYLALKNMIRDVMLDIGSRTPIPEPGSPLFVRKTYRIKKDDNQKSEWLEDHKIPRFSVSCAIFMLKLLL